MALFENFPYTNLHELNLDWVIKVIKDFSEKYPEMIEDISKKINKPESDPNGEYGTFLMSLGDGTTSWANISDEYSEIIIAAVDEWLNDHPEATTTVEDGSITPVKLGSELMKAYQQSGNVIHFFPSYENATYTQNIALIKTPNKTILMDCGQADDWDLWRDYLTDLYNNHFFTNIDYIIISHYHFDHVDNLINILNTFPHENCKVFLPPTIEGHYAERSDLVATYDNIISYLTGYAIDYEIINEKTTRELDENFVYADFYNTDPISWAFYDISETVYNNYTMVTNIKVGDTYAMYPGDIQRLGQKYIYEHNNLPSLNLFVYPHHAVQDDDYLPFLRQLDPENTIITSSPNRIMVANLTSISNYVSGKKYVLAYGETVFVSDKASGSIIEGEQIYRIGRAQNSARLYVDNEYTGIGWDGTEEKPYRSLDEAIMHISTNPGIYNIITIKPTATSYGNAYIRDIDAPIEISSQDNTMTNKPIFDWIVVDNCDHVEFYGIKFAGEGRTAYSQKHLFANYRSVVYMSNCYFEGVNASNANAIQLSHNIDMYVYNTYFKDFSPTSGQGNGVCVYQYGKYVTRGNTYDHVDAPYRMEFLDLTIESADTLSNGSRWIVGAAQTGFPFRITRQAITATNLAQIGGSAFSLPVYYEGNVAIIKGNKLYNILTGEEITVS